MAICVILAVFLAILFLCLGGSRGGQTTNSTNTLKPTPYIHLCYKDDLDFSECIVQTMNDIRDRMVYGIPAMGVPPTEPLFLDEVAAFEVAGLSIKLKNVISRGASNIKFVSAKASLETGQFEFVCTLDRVQFSGEYVLSSAIAFIPFFFEGKTTATATDVVFYVDSQTEIVNKNGIDFLNIVSLNIRAIVGRAYGILWIGQQRMDLISQIISTPFNSRIITETLLSSLQPVVSKMVLKISNSLFGDYPYDVLIPDHRPQTGAATTANIVGSQQKLTNHQFHSS